MQTVTPTTRVPLPYYTRLHEIHGDERHAFCAYVAEHVQNHPTHFYNWDHAYDDYQITLPLARFDALYALFRATAA